MATTAPKTTTSQYRILIVEDEQDIARVVLKSLSSLGLECHYAPDGPTGWEAFEQTDPHLVLTDIRMPGFDGFELCSKIRESSTVPVIMMTALDKEEQQLHGFKIGADDYIPKPFNPKLLVARVVAQLRRVYRYDADNAEELQRFAVTSKLNAAAEAETENDSPKLRSGWAQCESCNYMGPRQRFEKVNALGARHSVCPNCRQTDYIVFSID
jgi:DNA-binding response OmpR family regulator